MLLTFGNWSLVVVSTINCRVLTNCSTQEHTVKSLHTRWCSDVRFDWHWTPMETSSVFVESVCIDWFVISIDPVWHCFSCWIGYDKISVCVSIDVAVVVGGIWGLGGWIGSKRFVETGDATWEGRANVIRDAVFILTAKKK